MTFSTGVKALLSLLCNIAFASAQPHATVSIDIAHPGAPISPLLYGLMTEEIFHSYDGGLYAELIHNRTFQDDAKSPVHWAAIGGATMALDRENPVNAALPVSLKIVTPAHVNGPPVGVTNEGFWGIGVRPATSYSLSFYARSDTDNAIIGALQTADGKTTHAIATAQITNTAWKKYICTIETHEAKANKDNRLILMIQQPGTVWISNVSLMPPTYDGKANGLRADLMKLMIDMKPSFLRFPGGNYLEGDTIATRFDWKKAIGPVDQRPGHMGCWGYRSSDGFGLPEFLGWVEALNVEPILAVYAGYSLKGEYIAPGEKLKPFVDDALDEIEYCTGDASTTWGKKRIEDGHPNPLKIRYIEIGNEDWFDKSKSYDGRFTQFADAIKAKYPEMQCIATAPVTTRRPDVIDDHFYYTPRKLQADQTHYDKTDRNGVKIFVGEWASVDGEPTGTLRAGLADAAYLMGLERNSDVVTMSCYAPLLVNVDDPASIWWTNLIGFDAQSAFGSPSYWAQRMINENKGDFILPTSIKLENITPQPAAHGRIALATKETAAEFKEISVVRADGKTLFDSSKDQAAWTFDRIGDWSIDAAGLIKQAREHGERNEQSRAVVGDNRWSDYTVHLKARKLGNTKNGSITVQVLALAMHNVVSWTIGGDRNHALLRTAEAFDEKTICKPADVSLEPGRWYDLRVEVAGAKVTTFIDGQQTNEATADLGPTDPPIFAQTCYSKSTGEAIVKLVNATDEPVNATIQLTGAASVNSAGRAFELIGDSLDDQNSIEQPDKVREREQPLTNAADKFDRVLPARSFTVLRIKAR